MTIRNEIQFHITTTSPGEMLESFLRSALAAQVILGDGTGHLQTNLSNDGFGIQKSQPDGPLAPHLKALVDRVISDTFERIDRIQTSWPEGTNVELIREPDYTHSLKIRAQQAKPELAKVLEAFRARFSPLDYQLERFKGLPAELAVFHVNQTKVFAEQRAELLKGYETIRSVVAQAEDNAQARIRENEAKYQQKEVELDGLYKGRLEEVERARQLLEEAKKQLDDRGRMHVRREHQKNLATILQKGRDFAYSRSTNRKRWVVHGVCLVTLALAAVLYSIGIGWISTLGFATEPDGIRSVSVPITGAVLFVSTLVFYLRWINDWFRSHAQAEMAVHAMDEDFTRAAWLVELLFEWNKEAGGTRFPPEILGSLSRGLFTVSRDTRAHPDHIFAELIANLPSVREVTSSKKGFSVRAEPLDAKRD